VTEPETKSSVRSLAVYLQSVAVRSVGKAPGHTLVGADGTIGIVCDRAVNEIKAGAMSRTSAVEHRRRSFQEVRLRKQFTEVVVQ
jgi:hypothetical protein